MGTGFTKLAVAGATIGVAHAFAPALRSQARGVVAKRNDAVAARVRAEIRRRARLCEHDDLMRFASVRIAQHDSGLASAKRAPALSYAAASAHPDACPCGSCSNPCYRCPMR